MVARAAAAVFLVVVVAYRGRQQQQPPYGVYLVFNFQADFGSVFHDEGSGDCPDVNDDRPHDVEGAGGGLQSKK